MAQPVTVVSEERFRCEVDTGTHHFVMDEPASAGGTDEGPTPYDLLAAAIGGCKAMTLRFYAQREKIPLERVEVRVTHDRMHANDCADCLTKAGFIHRFDVELRMSGALSEEQRTKLFDVAKRCPVAKTLSSEIKIVDRWG